KAARQDHAEAQYRLGWMFIDGRGVKANSKKASKWFARASELGISVDRGRPSDIPDPSTDALAASVPAAAAAAPDEPAPAATDPAPAVVATQAPPPEEEAREAK
ncbi:MAG: hypothetical protein GWN07_26625, partial [Actinobacteria bacterium]|nr:SEL1-like repeat protein [Actinomycetota bacterium]NIS34200.1 SEL1-like repeat protein [Actinomycetota bacterium]NIU68973.1 SEL1-like repeat protein [Actinomycetota bacterium]NIW30825.1 hypothetical protein [Actinomycetota bacterium]NIX23211.1 hypothetical protein [Actinomycetota bacterium]